MRGKFLFSEIGWQFPDEEVQIVPFDAEHLTDFCQEVVIGGSALASLDIVEILIGDIKLTCQGSLGQVPLCA
jgi:hypothetical protein